MIEIKKCKTKAGWTAKKNTKLDLAKIAERYEVVLDTKILLVVKTDCGEVVVHDYGELMFKECDDAQKIEKLAREILGDDEVRVEA